MRKNSNFSEKTWGLNASQSKKNLFLMFSIALFLMVLPLISAIELNPFAVTKIVEKSVKANMPEFLKTDFNSDYGVIRLSKTIFWIPTDKVAEYSLTSNTERCYLNCEAKGKAVLYSDGSLFEDINFKDTKNNLYEMDKYQFWLFGGYETKTREVCAKYDENTGVKGEEVLIEPKCLEYTDETYQEEIWNAYNYEPLKAGDYQWKLTGSKKSMEDSVDWLATSNGKVLTEWAYWLEGTAKYIYVGGTNKTVQKFLIDDASLLATSEDYGGTILDIKLDDTYVYYGGETTNKVYKVYKTNLSNNISSASYGGYIGSITVDDTYVYYGGGTTNKVYRAYKTNLSDNISSASYGGTIWSIAVDDTYVYYGGGTTKKVYRAYKTNLSDNISSASYGGIIRSITVDDTYVYYGGETTNKVYKVYKTNLSNNISSGNYGGAILSISLEVTAVPTITLNAPVNAYNSSSNSITFNATATSTSGITNVSLYLNGVLNETNTSGINATDYLFTKTLTEGSHNWSIKSCNADGCTTSATRTFTIDTTAPVLSDVALNTSTVYAVGDKVKLNFTATDTHLSTCWYEYNGANTTIAGCQSGVQNQTDITTVAGQTTIRVWANDTFGLTSLPSTVTFAYDTTKPQFTLNSLANVSTVSLPVNASLNVTTTDVNLDDCWYYTSDSSTNITYTCNSVANVSFSTGGDKTITIWANDTVGNSNSTSYPVRIYDFNVTQTGSSALPEGTSATFTLVVNSTSFPIGDADAVLWYDGINKGVTTKTVTSANIITFTTTFIIPDGTGNSTGAFKNWNWEYNATQLTTRNSSTQTQTVYAMEIGDCATSGYGTVILNMTLKDEETNAIIPQANATVQNLEIDLQIFSLSNSSLAWTFNKTWTNASYGAVCIPNNILNNTNYSIDFIAEYGSTGYVNEFYFLDDGTLWNGCSFNSYTSCNISLMDLLSTDSTTFLFEFTDENGLKIDDAIIHTYRKYIGEGLFREVERSSQDETGQTHIHLVEEDVIYYFMVSQYGEIIYTSSNYNAKCLSTPCTIELSAQSSFTPFPTNWSEFDGTNFSITSNKTTRQVSLNFLSDSIKTLNMTIFKYDSSGNVEYINSSNLTASAGTITLTVPNPYGNETFFVSTFIDGTFTRSQWVDFRETAREIFGTSGAVLGGLMVLAVILMAVSEGVGFIIFTVLSVGLVAIMQLVDLTWMAVISIVVAGALIVWKLVARRNA